MERALNKFLTFSADIPDQVLQQFIEIPDTFGKMNFVLETLLRDTQIRPEFITDCKNNERSSDLRIKGNELFLSKKDEEALKMYTYSILLAEVKSENLGLAYANRSAVLFRLGFYEECVQDIDRAFENNYPDALKAKINERKEKALSLKDKQKKLQYYQPMPSIDVNDRNPLIECASNCVEIKNDSKQGRYVVATRDIEIGEIIAVENPSFSVLIDEKWCHCHHCLMLCYNLVPCSSCTKALFCSSSCKDNSITYHKYECPILATMERIHLFLIPLRIAMSMRDCYKTFEEEIKESDSVYKSRRYKEIHNLVTNEINRSRVDLFKIAYYTGAFYLLLRDHTDFFGSGEDFKDTFVKLIFKHLQTMTCNFHDIGELYQYSNGNFDFKQVGVGAYNFMSLFNHSCTSNVHRTYYGISICMTAIRTIRKGEQLFDNYGCDYTVHPKSLRQSKLKQRYFFDCHCPACENNWESYDKWKPSNEEYKFLLPFLNAARDATIGDWRIARRMRPNLIEAMKKIDKKTEENKPHYIMESLCPVLVTCDRSFGNVRKQLA